MTRVAMSNDELILEIIEKVHEQSRETARRVNDIHLEQIRHGEMHRVNTLNLQEHMSRTEGNEEMIRILNKRIDDLENDKQKKILLINFSIKVIAVLGTIIGFFTKILPYLLTLV